ELTMARPQNVSLVTYFTNWQGRVSVLDCGSACQEVGYTGGSCQKPSACVDENELGTLGEYGCPSSKICCCE
ncbi:MAG: hypothetical protein O2U61_04575, partial [Candidatus Bathyarchaeota archaeon]|nr:hypothetical protein [Candidatus Bathyarchaeota archaeon]